jgi:effector-binding domain-containing protein
VLAGKPGDPSSVDELTLTSKPAISIIGQTTWDKATDTLQSIFARLEREAGARGLAIAGRPLTVFLETDDIGFRYEAMLPVARAAEGLATPGEVRAAQTPAGRVMRFVHKAPYDDIEATYEGITAYLDAKGVIVRDQFVEEYVSPLSEAGDIGFEANIYVLPR